MKTAGLILTAGRNALSGPSLQRLVLSLRLAGVETIVLSAPQKELPELHKQAARLGVIFLGCSSADSFELARTGLAYLRGQGCRVLIIPAEYACVRPQTLELLLAGGAELAEPVCGARCGYPLLLSPELVPVVVGYDGPDGLRGALQASGKPCAAVEVEDAGIYLRVDELEEAPLLSTGRLRPVLKLRVARETPFLGPGSCQLLRLIDLTGSVRQASGQMGISYSKAWKLLNNIEQQTGFAVLTRQPGGKNGGETRLTAAGQQLLEQFAAFERECVQAVNEIFKKHYRGLL